MRLEGRGLVDLLANPTSVAVIGASSDPSRLSGRPLHYLRTLGYAGSLYAVNARTDLPGVPTVRAVSDLPVGEIDVALVALPATSVLAALREAEAIGVKAAVVIGSGFEDRLGAPRKELDQFAAESELRLIGPNCVGTLGVADSSYLTFSSVLQQELPKAGRIGLVTQSGALGNSLLQTLIRRHVGLHQWFSTGNEVDAGAIELTVGLLERDGVDAVGVFLEGVTDPTWLGRLDSVIRETGKPLFLLKAAQSDSGRRAAAGHTGRIVGSSDASDAILSEMDVRLVSTVGELADALVLAGVSPQLRTTSRPRVAVVSVSGAAGVIGADRIAQDGRLRMAEPESGLPLDARLHVANPLDVPFIGETGVFSDALIAVGSSPGVDVVLAVESSLAHEREELVAKLVAAETTVPLVLTSLSEDDPIARELTSQLSDGGIAYLPTIERAVAAVGACSTRSQGGEASLSEGTEASDRGEDAGVLRGLEWIADHLPTDTPWAGWKVLDAPRDSTGIEMALSSFGLPLVVKAAGRTIEHRTELGAVRIARSDDELVVAVEQVGDVCNEHGDAVMLQKIAPSGFEVLVSVLDDPEFGPVAFVRPGGTFAELLTGQAVLWSGWSRDHRRQVLARSRVGELLTSYRGGPRYDLQALEETVSACLALVASGDVAFLELNPVLVHERGLTLIDAVGRS